jgi:hypothetical protein
MAKNNAGNGYFAVLPNNEETKVLIKVLRSHLSPDRKIRVRGQGTPTDGNSWKHYSHGLPVRASSHVRLYLQDKDPAVKRGEEKYWFDAFREERRQADGLLSELFNLKQALKELVK